LKYIACLLICLLPCIKSHAQKDSAVFLHDVNVEASRLSIFNTGLKKQTFDSTLLAAYSNFSLSELVNENSAIALKQYGRGGLSTISLRGGSAYHTAILWNGFSLTSPLNGLTDLSLLKNFFFDDVSIVYGGNSTLCGSGSVSGTLQLNNLPSLEKGLKITTGIKAGSFSSFNEFVSIEMGFKKYSFIVKAFNLNDNNNFTYYDVVSKRNAQQINASIKENGILNEHYFRLSDHSTLCLRGWLSWNNRFIPPALNLVNAHARQKDYTSRFSGEWKSEIKRFSYELRSAYFIEKQFYDDDFLRQPSDNKSRSFINEATSSLKIFSRQQLQFGMNQSYACTDSSSEISKSQISSLAIFGLYHFSPVEDKIQFSMSVRKEFSSLNNGPFVYSAGLAGNPSRNLQVRFSFSRVFRNPTLNDLFWNPGGNALLKPETGFSSEAGININAAGILGIKQPSASQITLSATTYYKKINNWIAWYPFTSYLWKPENLLEVVSRGLETDMDYRFTKNNFSTGINFNYFYTISTNEKSLIANDASIHKQLIYVPLHTMNFRLFIIYRTIGFHLNHSYTGYRYTLSDNSESLEPYALTNASIDKTLLILKMQSKMFFRVNNIFDSKYQSVQNRPMPLRSWEGGITFTFTKKPQTK
jgi:iron complex outermembrane receptor protein